jgi:glycine/D-amino acid oxidase-like deaminating enzyme/nitrite reductase/ring-hydroxylating ferredoxin subunit
MGSLHERNPSLWVTTTAPDGALGGPGPLPAAPVDVAVVGAGIAGLTAARLLAAAGASVAVVEAGHLCSGVTAYTTAKLSALQQVALSEVASRHGPERAAQYAAGNVAALERVARFVADDGIDCDFERAPACTFTADPDRVGDVEAEHAAATAAGVPTRLDATTELPLEVAAAVWLDDQAQFHPRRYCLGLAAAAARDGAVVLEGTRVTDVVDVEGGVEVRTDAGPLLADRVVLATHLPFVADGGFFARAHPTRSYAMAVRVDGPRPRGMYINVESPSRSLRSTRDGWLVVGGEGHKVGHDDDTRERYRALDDWAHEHLHPTEVGPRWSAQDYSSVDGLPYVGAVRPGRDRVLVATAFRKWGMTNGTAAGMLLDDLLAGRRPDWADAFDSTRLAPGASVKELVTENLDVGKRFVVDHLAAAGAPDASELGPGEGGLATVGGEVAACFRDDDGALHAVGATCTHLGCRVAFNTAERSWDCPCHGSRFGVDGRVLQGPAVRDLEPVEVPVEPAPSAPRTT